MPIFSLSFSVFSSSIRTLVFFLSSFMASSSYSNRKTNNTYTILPAAAFQKKPSNTTYIQTDVANFKDVVQKFTASREEKRPPPTHIPHPTAPPRPAGLPPSGEMGAWRPAFKLHERRQSGRMLEIRLNNNGGGFVCGFGSGSSSTSSASSARPPRRNFGFNCEKVMVSPVSPLEVLARGSPRTPRTPCSSPMDEEMRGIYEKGYYLHPNCATPRGVQPPQLLPLFPIHSPTNDDHDDNEDSSSSS